MELTEGMSDIEKEVLKRDVISRLEKIAEEVNKQNGTIPTHLEGLSNRIKKIKETVNWKSLFRKFVGTAVSSEILINRKRNSKRFEENPATKNKFKTSIVIGVDSSGSMSDFDISKVNGEIHNIWKAGAKTNYFAWDCEAGNILKYEGKLDFERTKAGGTSMDCAIEHINKNYKKYGWQAAIIGSDGYIPTITVKAKIPTMILITEKGQVNYPSNYKYKTVKMN